MSPYDTIVTFTYNSAINCTGQDVGFVEVSTFGVYGLAYPGSAYQIEYKYMEDEPKPECKDKNKKKCKKANGKKCKSKKFAKMCQKSCNKCDYMYSPQ